MPNNDITKKPQSTEVATESDNPFLAYANAMLRQNIVGHLLKFSKGDWMFGQENTEIPVGTKFIANMDNLSVGWIRWEDNRPADHVMGLVCEAWQIPPRNTLGYTDKSEWEVDDRGEPRDPWRYSNYLLLKDVENGDLFTFSASSKGGIEAVAMLLRTYGLAKAMKPDQYPIVALGGSSYNHPNRAYGKIKKPVFKLVGWSKKADFGDTTVQQDDDPEDDVADESQDQIVEFPEPVKAATQKGKPRGRV